MEEFEGISSNFFVYKRERREELKLLYAKNLFFSLLLIDY